MKAKRYKIAICDSVLDMTHGFTHTIDEISAGDIFINEGGVWRNYDNRANGATDIVEIDLDDTLYTLFKNSLTLKESIDIEIKTLFKSTTKKPFISAETKALGKTTLKKLPHTERRRKK